MSRDSDHPKSDLPPNTADGGGGASAPAEDPLLELARIVHQNKQAGAAATEPRMGGADYFSGLDDVIPAQETPVEPATVGGQVSQPNEALGLEQSLEAELAASAQPQAAPEPAASPADSPVASGEVSGIPWPKVPSLEEIELTASQAMQRPAAGSMNYYSSNGTQSTEEKAEEIEIPQSQLEHAVSQNLEDSLTAELEDELIGAFRQSFSPVGEPAAAEEPQPEPAVESDYEAQIYEAEVQHYQGSAIPGYETQAHQEPVQPEAPAPEMPAPEMPTPEMPVTETPVEEPEQAAPAAYSWQEPAAPGYSTSGAARREPSFGQPSFGQPANDSSQYRDEDLFAGLNDLEEETRTYRPEPQAERSAIDPLFSDLEFSRRAEPSVEQPTAEPEPVEPVQPEAYTGAFEQPARSDDIDDMVWPAAASAIPAAEDEDTPPPPEGYDLDAVARAMHESDPTLKGAGVLPPHPQAEVKAAPGAEERSRKGLYAAAAVLAVVILGGGSLLMFDGSSVDVPSGPPPIIAGLQGPLKVYPDAKPKDENQTAKLIYDRVGTPEEPADERMVLPEETTPAELPPAPDKVVTSDPLVPGAPKKVRTLVVRPDGTIISGTPEVATTGVRTVETTPTTGTPAPAPAVPTTQKTAAAQPAPAAPATPAATAEPAQPETPAAAAPDATATLITSVMPREKPAVPVQVAQAPVTPTPVRTTPVRTTGPLNLNNPAPATAQPATPAPAAPATGRIAPGTYVVQVTSQRSEDAARSAYQGLQQRYPSVLAGRQAVIVSANIENRGTFYRARIPTGSRDEAISLCESLKTAGGDCFVRRN